MSIMARQLRELVNTSRLGEVPRNTNDPLPVNYGKKRTLAPLPAAAKITHIQRPQTPARGHNLDNTMVHLDATFVSDWLTRANDSINELQEWWVEDENSIEFTHFWLMDLADDKRQQLLQMEYDLLFEEVRLAFRCGLDESRVTDADIRKVLRAVMPEFPDQFGGGDGTAFLDMARGVSNGKSPKFKALLSAVKCSTKNSQYAQWLLATRAFALISMITSVTRFFCRLQSMTRGDPDKGDTGGGAADGGGAAGGSGSGSGSRPGTSTGSRPGTSSGKRPTTSHEAARPGTATSTVVDVRPKTAQRPSTARPGTAVASRVSSKATNDAFRAAKLGYADVLYYMLSRGLVSIDVVDALERTLLFVACKHEQMDVVGFLLENAERMDVNQQAASGNSPLHVAVSIPDEDMAKMLLAAGADPDNVNPTSGATPRLTAEIFGHDSIVKLMDSCKEARVARSAATTPTNAAETLSVHD